MRRVARRARSRGARTGTVLAAVMFALAACTAAPVSAPVADAPEAATAAPEETPAPAPEETPAPAPEVDDPRGVVTLGFAGDIHFEYHLRALLDQPRTAFGSMRRVMQAPDLMMVNLESAITERGTEEPKQYRFRVSARALDVLARAGVDVASLANNHAADYGRVGFRDTLAAVRRSPVPVIGVGRNADAAFRPFVTSVRGTDVAVLAATTKPDHTARAWAAGERRAGVAVALRPHRRLLSGVRMAAERADVVVVYLHWGHEGQACPTGSQEQFARALSRAGADIVLGSHAHALLGSGWRGPTYVNYGLGNFLWYHDSPPETGVLQVRVRNGEVVGDSWVPARITANGPELLPRRDRAGAVRSWRALRGCTGLAAAPSR